MMRCPAFNQQDGPTLRELRDWAGLDGEHAHRGLGWLRHAGYVAKNQAKGGRLSVTDRGLAKAAELQARIEAYEYRTSDDG
jgi:DNA-binding IclR family transcriptional regulator